MNRKQKKDIRTLCIYGIRILFLLCITFVTFEAYTYRADDVVKPLPLLLIIVLTLGCLYIVKYFAKKYNSFIKKYLKWLLFFYLLTTFIIQIVLGSQMRYTPMWDLGSVYNGAISWLEQGNISEYADYFYYFPNNLGLMLLFKGYFTVIHIVCGIVGIGTDYFLAVLVLGDVAVTIFRFSVIWISKKLFGEEYAVTAMVLLLLCIPLYFAAAVFYTDIMSFAAPALFYLLYLYAKETDSFKKKTVYYVLMAFVAAFGMEVKFTVIIIVIAVGIEVFLTDGWKHFLLMAGINAIVIATIFSAANNIVYSGLLVKEQAELQNTPYLHWIMMGAQGNGSYNPADYEFTRSFEDKEERQEALKAEIVRRYKELGIKGTLELWKNKTKKCFGDGTYALSDFLDDEPIEESIWSKWILYSSENYDKYQTICLGVFVAIMLLMFFGAVGSLIKGYTLKAEMTSIWLAFLGIWMFLMIWEVSERYFTNYLSVMLLAALFGLFHFERFIVYVVNRLKNFNLKS